MSDKGLDGTTFNLPAISSRISLFDRVWPPAAILVGLTVTAVWVGVLGYGLLTLVF
jgi:hypothetical protein